jgi:O-acetyl-ADP-ribose deacetylase (regulator of RNase III)
MASSDTAIAADGVSHAAVAASSAGRLQAKFVIHTVGPVYTNAEESAPLLRQAYL